MDSHPLTMLSKKEVAALLKISERQVDHMRDAGIFQAYKIGGQIRFKQADINAYIESTKEKTQC